MRLFLRTAFFLLLTLISPNRVFAEIIQTSDLHVLNEVTEKADRDTLVIFDVDYVLIVPTDQILHPAYKSVFRQYEKKLTKRSSRADFLNLWGIIFSERKSAVVDSTILSIIHDLQHKKIKTIALTNTGTGQLGRIKSLEDWRIKELISHEVDFSSAFRVKRTIPLGLPSPRMHGPPIFKSGIIFTAGHDKGDILEIFLKKVRYKPCVIIFVDDKLEKLESVEEMCKRLKIKFIGIHYIALKNEKVDPLNKKRVQLQFKLLQKEHKWLSDKEADQRLR